MTGFSVVAVAALVADWLHFFLGGASMEHELHKELFSLSSQGESDPLQGCFLQGGVRMQHSPITLDVQSAL